MAANRLGQEPLGTQFERRLTIRVGGVRCHEYDWGSGAAAKPALKLQAVLTRQLYVQDQTSNISDHTSRVRLRIRRQKFFG